MTAPIHLWTSGDEHVVVTGRGVARRSATGWELHPATATTTRAEPAMPELVAVVEAGQRGLIRRATDLVVVGLDAAADEEVIEGPEIDAAVTLGDRLLVATRRERADGRSEVTLALAELDGASLRCTRTLAWPEPARVAWPEGLGEATWPDGAREAPFAAESLGVAESGSGGDWPFRRIELAASAQGVVATGVYAGLVVGFDPATLDARFAVRVPVTADTELRAVPTAAGVLLVFADGQKQASLVLLDWSGALVAHRDRLARDPAAVLGAPLLLEPAVALVTTTEAGAQVAFKVALPELTTRRAKAFDGMWFVAQASTFDGGMHLVAIAEDPAAPPHKLKLVLMRRDKGKLKQTDLALPDLRPAEAPVPAGAERATGRPSPGVRALAPFACALGQEGVLELELSNAGGVGSRLTVEVSGDVMKRAVVALDFALADAAPVALASSGASAQGTMAVPIDAATINQGARSNPKRIVEPVKLPLRLRLRGEAETNDILFVTVTIEGADGAASAKLGRPIRVA